MKRFLSVLLCAAILVATPVHLSREAEAAGDPYKMILQLDAASDVTDFGLTESQANNVCTKLSSYSAPWIGNNTGSTFTWNGNANLGVNGKIDITGYKYLNLWIHSNEYFQTYVGPILFRTSDSKTKTDAWGIADINEGWNLITMELYAATPTTTGIPTIQIYTYDNITGMQFMLKGSYASSSGREIYVDSIFVSNDLPENVVSNEFSTLNVKEGTSTVLTDIGTVKFKAPNLIANSVDNSDVTITYCSDDETVSGTMVAGEDFTVSTETNTLLVNFTGELDPGTTYNIDITGAGLDGELALPFDDFDLSFRTLGEGENIPPTVSLIDLEANERFFPSDGAITLKASASDDNGEISKVEFYKGSTEIEGNKIGEVTESVDDVYTFVWENPDEDVNGYEIIAKAYDDQGDTTETEPIPILVLDLQDPVVTITAPIEDVILNRNVSGVTNATDVTLSAEVSCLGAEPALVEFILDGETVYESRDVASSYSYTYADLPVGEHQIYIKVTDNYDQWAISDGVDVTVRDLGRAIPGLLFNDFEEYADGDSLIECVDGANLDDFVLTGNKENILATEFAYNMVGKIETASAGENTVYSRYRHSLSSTPWEAAVQVYFSDTEHERSVTIGGASDGTVLTFGADGNILNGEADSGLDYKAGEWYELRVVVNPMALTLSAFIDEQAVLSNINIANTYSQSGAAIQISQKGQDGTSGYVLFDNMGFYKLSETNTRVIGINIYDENSNVPADLHNVPVSADKLAISLTEELGSSLINNVKVIDIEENRKLALSFDDNYVYFGEVLRSNRTYQVIVTTGISGVSGRAIAKKGVYTFTTKPNAVEVTEARFSESALSDSVSSVTCSFDFDIHSGTGHTAYIVGIVYDGDAMANIMIQPVTVTDGTITSNPVTIDAYTEDTFIEVFVVRDLVSMTPVSETIYSIK